MVKLTPQGFVTEGYKRAVQSALKSRGYTQKEFALMIGIEPQIFASWLGGHMKNKKRAPRMIHLIAKYLGV